MPALLGRGMIFAIVAGLFVLAYVLLFWAWTGLLPFGAGYARLIESINVDSVWILGQAINTKVLLRLAAYGTAVLPALYAVTVLMQREVEEDTVLRRHARVLGGVHQERRRRLLRHHAIVAEALDEFRVRQKWFCFACLGTLRIA